MHGCSFPLSCWLNAHLVVTWLIAGGIGVLCLVLLIASIRAAYRLYQSLKETEAQQAEKRREEQAFHRRAWRTIRMAEEWDVDVTELRQHVGNMKLRQRIRDALLYQRYRVLAPMALGFTLMTVGSIGMVSVAWVSWLIWLFYGLSAAVILLLLWAGWQLVVYVQLKSKLEPIVQQLRTQQ